MSTWVSEHWTLLIGPAVVAAGISGLITIIGFFITTGAAKAMHSEKLAFDQKLAESKFEFEKELAERKFSHDKAQTVHKRQFELAEALLTDAYQFRDLMDYVRNGVAFNGEGESRNQNPEETESISRLKNTYFVPCERLQQESEFISGFMAKKHSAIAHFGPAMKDAFELASRSMNRVRVASRMLIDTAGQPISDPDLHHQLCADIWARYGIVRGGEDAVQKEIDEALSLIEGVCQPVLAWTGAE